MAKAINGIRLAPSLTLNSASIDFLHRATEHTVAGVTYNHCAVIGCGGVVTVLDLRDREHYIELRRQVTTILKQQGVLHEFASAHRADGPIIRRAVVVAVRRQLPENSQLTAPDQRSGVYVITRAGAAPTLVYEADTLAIIDEVYADLVGKVFDAVH